MEKPLGLGKQVSGKVPPKNSAEWKRNESLIAKSPVLRRMKDITNGFAPTSAINTGVNDEQYKTNYDKITWAKDKPKPKFKVRVNGKIVNDNEEQ